MNHQKNPITLSFLDTALENEYYNYQFQKSKFLSRFGIITGIFLYAIFAFLDIQIVPDYIHEIWFIRFAVVIPYLFFLLVFSFTRYYTKYWQLMLISLGIVGGIGIIAMINISSAQGKELYPTGLMIVIMWSYLFSGLRCIYATITCLFVLLVFSISALVISPMMIHIYVNHMFFLTSAFVIGMFAGYTIESYSRGEFIKNKILVRERQKSDNLLQNILPSEVAGELKENGIVQAKYFDAVTVMFTDFKEFTRISEKLAPAELVAEINLCFITFDNIISKYNIEKIKTIGDSYMCTGGLPVENKSHSEEIVRAALEIRDFMETEKLNRIRDGRAYFEIRIGCHTGPVVAGIVGVKKFQYDIWGDTVNTASRMESLGTVGKVNISQSTYEQIKDNPDFSFEHRGQIEAKGKGELEMYFVEQYTSKR